ncbi:MAG: Maf family protein, partial [Bacteroidota bacterium]|nr:Maf family protein [Bacteroidota bacterium]
FTLGTAGRRHAGRRFRKKRRHDSEAEIQHSHCLCVVDSEVLGKPCDAADARRMLQALSGRAHQVITGVCLTSIHKQRVFAVSTEVSFKSLTDEEIDYYIANYRPYDKAGAYGIQEWIGYIGVTGLRGSYFNVMGLPVQRIYEELVKW